MSNLLSSRRLSLFNYIDRQLFFRLVIISGMVFAALALGVVTAMGRPDPKLILAASVAMLGLAFLNRDGRFEHGILAIIVAAGLINFFTLPTGSESRLVISLVIALALIGLWVMRQLLVDKRITLKPSLINLPIIAFILVNFVSYIWSNLMRDPLIFVWRSFPVVQIAALVVNILLPVLALFIANQIEDTKWLKRLVWIYIGIGAFVIVSIRFNLPTDRLFSNGFSGLFATWVVAFSFALALFNEKLPVWQRAALLGLVGLWFIRNFIQGQIWVSGWLPIMVSIVLITFFRSKKLFLLAMVISLVYLGLNFNQYYQSIYVANVEEGGLQRLDLWQTNLQHVANHPIFGMGPAGYAVYNMTYNPEDARSTHNNYFDILAQTGVVGFLIFLWLIASFAREGFEVLRKLRGKRDFEEAYAIAVLAGGASALVAMMLGDWVLPFAYNSTISGFDHTSYTWIFLGGLIALGQIVKSRESSKD